MENMNKWLKKEIDILSDVVLNVSEEWSDDQKSTAALMINAVTEYIRNSDSPYRESNFHSVIQQCTFFMCACEDEDKRRKEKDE